MIAVARSGRPQQPPRNSDRLLSVRFPLEIVSASLGDAHLRPLADPHLGGTANAYDAVDFRRVAARARHRHVAVDSIDQYLHPAANLAGEALRADLGRE